MSGFVHVCLCTDADTQIGWYGAAGVQVDRCGRAGVDRGRAG